MARNRLLRIAATAAVMLVVVVALDARPAAAAATGDWSHNNQLCYGNCTRTGNTVRLWQSILWSESYAADVSFIDGDFGPKTRDATKNWQRARGLAADGIVGPLTWGRAHTELTAMTSDATYDYFACPDPSNNRWFMLRQTRTARIWSFQNPRTGAWTGT